jgi:hypothetical protein
LVTGCERQWSDQSYCPDICLQGQTVSLQVCISLCNSNESTQAERRITIKPKVPQSHVLSKLSADTTTVTIVFTALCCPIYTPPATNITCVRAGLRCSLALNVKSEQSSPSIKDEGCKKFAAANSGSLWMNR